MDNADMPAMPISEEATDRIQDGIEIYTGLTKREAFAKAAMQAILSDCRYHEEMSDIHIALASVDQADALLDALAQGEK